ncbi:LysR family transcriptional regulator [Nonomuraea africana]|uniref:LysR family transcriptional regulator n=1 Tax=Nonomuraea africana TaxID=46171 RepID=UPI0033C10713
MIDVARLRVLREVARHGSFSKAAAALLFTPSAVSQQISALERAVGAPVVERSTRGVVLTEAGRLLVESADAIFAELHRTRERISRLTTGRSRLTVATFTSGGRRLLPYALERFVAARPDVEVNVVEGEPEVSLSLVREGKADLAVAYHFDGPLPISTGLHWTPLMDDLMSVALPPGHPLERRDDLDLAELAAESWMIGCTKTEGFLRRYAAAAGFELRVSGSTTDYFFAQALVAAGLGVTLVPELGLDPGAADATLVPIRPPRPARYVGVATSRRHHSPLVEAMTGALREAASQLVDRTTSSRVTGRSNGRQRGRTPSATAMSSPEPNLSA